MVKDERIKDKIMVVSSNEKPVKLNDRIPGSNSFVPSTAGLLCASYIINQIKKLTINSIQFIITINQG